MGFYRQQGTFYWKIPISHSVTWWLNMVRFCGGNQQKIEKKQWNYTMNLETIDMDIYDI